MCAGDFYSCTSDAKTRRRELVQEEGQGATRACVVRLCVVLAKDFVVTFGNKVLLQRLNKGGLLGFLQTVVS